MPFDPDKFLAETADTTGVGDAAPFDPDKFLAETEVAPSEPSIADKVYPLNAAIDKAAQEHVARLSAGDNPVTSGIRAGAEVVAAHVSELPGVKQVGEAVGKYVVKPVVEGMARESAAEAQALGIDPNKPHDLLSLASTVAQAAPQPVKDIAATAGVAAGFIPGGAVGKGLVKGVLKAAPGKAGMLEKASEKILDTYLKAPSKIYKEGFDVKNIDKYDLYGYTDQIAAKAQAAIDQRYGEVKRLLAESGDQGKTVDFYKAFDETLRYISENKTKFPALFESAAGKEAPLDEVTYTYLTLLNRLSNGRLETGVDPLTANQLKQVVGERASAAFGKNTKEDDAMEAFGMLLYGRMRDQIESSSTGPIKQLNKEISEIIPIKNAAIRRMPIEKRNEAISLKETVGLVGSAATGNAAPIALALSDRMLKNPYVARILKRVGTAGRTTKEIGKAGARKVAIPAAAGASSAMFNGMESE